MGKVTFAAVIYKRFKTKEGKYPVKLRVTYNKKPTYFSTGIEAEAEDLALNSTSSNIPVRNNMLKYRIQQYVMQYEKAAESFDSTLFPEFTANDVMDYLRKAMIKDQGLKLDFVKYSNEFIKAKESDSLKAAQNYRRAVTLLCEYIGRDDFDISTLKSATLLSWEEHLRQKYGNNSRTVSMATSHIRTIHLSAQRRYNSEEMDEIQIRNPYAYYTPPKQVASTHKDIDPAIIQQMINNYDQMKGRERLSVAAFLLSFGLMGMNTPDLYESKAPINGVIQYNRHKTQARRSDRAEMKVKIPEQIMPLYNEYKDRTGKRAFNFYKRYSSYAYMQDAEIKGMADFKKRIEYEDRISNYAARHTWATIARSSKCEISMELIDDCLAHVGSHRIGDIYAKKDYSVLWKANEKVLATLDWSPLLKQDSL